MSTIQRVNFEPVTDVLPLNRRDFPLADPTLADPLNALVLVDGEWMTLDSSYRLIRAASAAGAGNAATLRSFPLWAERGRYDVQATSGRKMPVIWLGESEWDTRVFDASATVGSGAAITFVMQPLKVASITIGSRVYVGLVGHGGASDANPVVGYVTRLPAANGGKLRFRSGYRS
jgi:hypothetical protein